MQLKELMDSSAEENVHTFSLQLEAVSLELRVELALSLVLQD